MIESFAFFLIGLASLLSGLVRLLMINQHKTMIKIQNAKATDLCVLTGISSPFDLQDIFGLATLDGIWPSVTLAEIETYRRPLGQIVGRQWPNYLGIGIGLLGPILGWLLGTDVMRLFILLGFILQIIGWSFTAKLSAS